MKGYKLIALAAHANARMKNSFKDKPAGKEYRGKYDSAPDYRRLTDVNLDTVTPRLSPGRNPKIPVTAPISERKLKLVRRQLGYGRNS